MKGRIVGLMAAAATMAVALFLIVEQASAQQAPAATLEVPDNPTDHPASVQPLPFSHKTHVARNLQCRACHTNPGSGTMMTFPAVSTCMGCHNTVAKDRPAIQKLADFAKPGQPIPWVRVYQVTPGVHLDASQAPRSWDAIHYVPRRRRPA